MTSENRRDMEKVAIEKPVTPLARPGTEQPAGLLSAKPLATVPTTATAMGPNTVAVSYTHLAYALDRRRH